MGLPAGRPSPASCSSPWRWPASPRPPPASRRPRSPPPPGLLTTGGRLRPVRLPSRSGPHASRGGGVRARAGAGRVRGRCRGGGRRAAAVAVDGRVVAGKGRTRVVELDRDADVRAAARRLAGRPGVAYAEPDWVRRVDACDPDACWHLQPRPGANVVQAHQGGAPGAPSPWSTPGWRPGCPTWPVGSASAGAARSSPAPPGSAASRRRPRPPALTAPRWPA